MKNKVVITKKWPLWEQQQLDGQTGVPGATGPTGKCYDPTGLTGPSEPSERYYWITYYTREILLSMRPEDRMRVCDQLNIPFIGNFTKKEF
jgi:hypothetical protein